MTYKTIQGDVFDIIARKVYGDQNQVRVLLESNPAHAETAVFEAGVELVVPTLSEAERTVSSAPPWRR